MNTRDWTTATDTEVMDADLVYELELDRLPPEETAAMLRQFSERVEDTVLRTALATVPPEARTELEGLVAAKDAEALQSALVRHIPDYSQRMLQETIRFKRIMLQESPQEQAIKAAGKQLLEELAQSDE